MMEEPLVSQNDSRRRRRLLFWILGIAIVLAVAGSVIGILVWAASTSPIIDDDDGKIKYKFEDIFNSTFSPKSMRLRWLSVDSFAFQNSEGHIMASTINGIERMLVNASLVVDGFGKPLAINDFSVDPSGKFVLIATKTVQQWRHSFTAEYIVFNIILKRGEPLFEPQQAVSNVQWNPSSGPAVTYVDEGNLFIKELSKEPVQITKDGDAENIFNGQTGWLYEEEVFSESIAYWWSPDGSQLAFLRTDENDVQTFTYPWYDQTPYSEEIVLNYPKPGFPNPQVSVGLYDVGSEETKFFQVEDPWEYVYQVTWGGQAVFIELLTRGQNHSQVYSWTFNGTKEAVLSRVVPKGWIEPSSIPLHFVKDGDYFATLQAHNGFNHIALYTSNGTFIRFLTEGSWEVTGILAYRPSTDSLYFISTQVSPTERQLYRVQLDGSHKTHLTKAGGWYSASFGPSAEYFILSYSGPDVPSKVVRWCADASWEKVLEDNASLKKLLAEVSLPKKEFVQVPTADGQKMNGFVLYPHNFDASKKYPVLVNVYGGPNSQMVMKTFENLGFHTWVTTRLGYVVAAFDGRGTGARGNAWKYSVYKNLGEFETADQIAGMKWLLGQKWCSSVGIWGWSYGGYMTGMVNSHPKTPSSFGISVAPVSDWAFYDSAYTERYMLTPKENPTGYNKSSILDRTSNIKDNKYLLVHGTGDDNVHFQNSVELANALIRDDVQFQTMFYPNRDHSIATPGSRKHLYRMLGDFLKKQKE